MIPALQESVFDIGIEDLRDRDIYVVWNDLERISVFEKILSVKGLTEISRELCFDLPTLSEIKGGTVKPSVFVYFNLLNFLHRRYSITSLKLSGRSGPTVRLITLRINPQLLGMLHSDGFIVFRDKRALVRFTNKNKKLLKHFVKLVNQTFACSINFTLDKRDDIATALVPSVAARILYKKFGEKTTESVRAPKLNPEEIAPYLRGVFDGDGSIILYHKKFLPAKIRFTTGSAVYAEELKSLLAELGIFSRTRFCNNQRGHEWWVVEFGRHKDVLIFIKKVGSDHPRKKRIMQRVKPELEKRLCAFLPAA